MTGLAKVTVIGGGLAGCEAAYQALKRGLKVTILEMKPKRFSPAHRLGGLAELVCSNSFKSTGLENASGLLKEEMRLLGSLVIMAGEATKVPAGLSLAVDREAFSVFTTDKLISMGAEIIRQEVSELPDISGPVIIATGPLTSDGFAPVVARLVGRESLYFYDAVAPIVYRESINMSVAWEASRYGKGGSDFINCPLGKPEYDRFVAELIAADIAPSHGFDAMPLFEGCLPVEALARRGPETLAFGPMKPVGLLDPRTGERPHAVVQLRRDNAIGTLYNMVGFQTRLSYGGQERVFRMIPGLENAEFARLGKLHRNTYIDSPGIILNTCQLAANPMIFFAGQVIGVEGYLESSVSGLVAGINAARLVKGLPLVCPPISTITGALLDYVSSTESRPLQPMNANFGLLPQLAIRFKNSRDKKQAFSKRALDNLLSWLHETLETSAII
ncbi:methylenetetrahydrofolate--tRNA-(uracil(54)-C(5))-methyltransferase (FADH(2)-oxidizing) TrmFO [bacterium]|nr:MAG: methylenetetrahydrofolate--tRNA-(uracil(54)-C(5))-methyltransferase (FADH(2)-oxidizing) TrmFO [bacterium]